MQRAFRPALSACAVALVAAHLLAIAMAWSPSLHHRLHHGADGSHHACAVVTVLAGQLDQPDPPVFFAAPAEPAAPLADSFFPGAALSASRHDSPGRAPPAA